MSDIILVTNEKKPADWVVKNTIAEVAPAVTDDSSKKYSISSRWIDKVAGIEYVCVDNTAGAAVWKATVA